MKSLNLVVRFLLELVALVAVAAAGWVLAPDAVVGALLALALPLAVALMWGRFVAPKSPRRLADPGRLLVEALVFGSAVAAVGAVLGAGWAAALAVVVVVNEVLLFVWRQRDH